MIHKVIPLKKQSARRPSFYGHRRALKRVILYRADLRDSKN